MTARGFFLPVSRAYSHLSRGPSVGARELMCAGHSQPWQVCQEGKGPHISKPPVLRVVQMAPGPGPTSGTWLDVLKLLCVFVWGTVGRYSQDIWGGISRRVPQPGEHVCTHAHACACVCGHRTHPARAPARSFCSLFPASQLLRAWGAGLRFPGHLIPQLWGSPALPLLCVC